VLGVYSTSYAEAKGLPGGYEPWHEMPAAQVPLTAAQAPPAPPTTATTPADSNASPATPPTKEEPDYITKSLVDGLVKVLVSLVSAALLLWLGLGGKPS
jgi:hypothetical protein